MRDPRAALERRISRLNREYARLRLAERAGAAVGTGPVRAGLTRRAVALSAAWLQVREEQEQEDSR